MSVWHDTIAVFGDVDVVLRAVIVTVCVHVVLHVVPSANDAGTGRLMEGITAR